MWRLYPYMKVLWASALLIGGVVLELITGILGNCLFALFLQSSTCTLKWDILISLRPYVFWTSLPFLALGGLHLGVRRSHTLYRARASFALLKGATEIRPEDFGFQVLKSGEQAGSRRRPFYPTYISRTASTKDSNKTYDEEGLVDQLKASKGFVLLSSPLSGKSRTLYEVAKRMQGYKLLSPMKSREVPEDRTFSMLLKGRQVILLLEDLNDYISSGTPLQEIASKLDRCGAQWTVASTCGDGPEMAVIKAAEGTALGRFYREAIPLKLEFRPLTAEQKGELARSIGEEWDPRESDWHPTPGSITMEEPMTAMHQRFEHALTPEQQDTLRGLQLLASGGVQPFTHRRLRAVLEEHNLFERSGLHLQDCLNALAEQAFIRRPAPQDPVYPEPAYLLDSVTYTEGKTPRDDFTKLREVLAELRDHEGLVRLGVVFGFNSDPGQALACFDLAITQKPEDPVAWFNKGVSWVVMERYDEALESYDEALSRGYDNVETWHNKGLTLSQLGRHQEAIEAYDRASTLQPDFSEAWHGKGVALIDLDRYEEALAALDQALKLEPDHAEAWSNRGAALGELGRYQEALEAYDRATKYAPAYPKAWLGKGTALENMGRYSEALEANEIALHHNPSYPMAWHNKGAVLNKLGRQSEALRAYDQALNLEPDFYEAWDSKGTLLQDMGHHQEALQVFDEAIKVKPNFSKAWYDKGVVLTKFSRFEEALHAFEQATNHTPNFSEAWYNQGVVLSSLDRDQEALEAFDQAIRHNPRYAIAWSNKGVTLDKLGRYQEALEAFDQALDLGSTQPETWAAKGMTLGKLGRYQEALVWLCRAWRAREQLPGKVEVLARIFEQLGYDPQQCELDFPPIPGSPE
jgi:tetratricopeptide (TPR) repeat protein